MPKYVTDNGKEVKSDDPKRTIWYGQCGFWTDDWELLTKVGPGIPTCPKCKTPGFITGIRDWNEGIDLWDKKEPGYTIFCNTHKEKCYRHYPKGFMTAWELTKSLLEATKEKKE